MADNRLERAVRDRSNDLVYVNRETDGLRVVAWAEPSDDGSKSLTINVIRKTAEISVTKEGLPHKMEVTEVGATSTQGGISPLTTVGSLAKLAEAAAVGLLLRVRQSIALEQHERSAAMNESPTDGFRMRGM